MAGNKSLHNAKVAEDNEFYTTYEDIEKEMNEYYEYNKDVFRDKTILLPCDDPEWSNFTKYFVANFNRFGLKKLISTSYAQDKKPYKKPLQLSMFETQSPDYDEEKTNSHGKIFTLTRRNRNVNKDDLKWKYLEGDGDFRSDEVKALRDEADIIITNPPFALFREFLAWIMEANKEFVIIGNQNVYTYKEVFPLIKNNVIWIGTHSGDMAFRVPPESKPRKTRYWQDENGQKWRSMGNACWLTNLDHGKRHEPLQLMSMEDNLKYNKKLKKKFSSDYKKLEYPKYDNYDAIEVPFTEAIPSDYTGVMGVPITFLDKYNPEQFEILGITQRNDDPYKLFKYTKEQYENANDLNARAAIKIDGIPKSIYPRILIKHK